MNFSSKTSESFEIFITSFHVTLKDISISLDIQLSMQLQQLCKKMDEKSSILERMFLDIG